MILDLIDAEKELIFITVFALRNFNSKEHSQTLIESVATAVQRGALCIVVMDQKQAVSCWSVLEMFANDWRKNTHEKQNKRRGK